MGHQRCREVDKNKQVHVISEAEARSQRVSSHRRGGMVSEGLEVTCHVDFGCPWRVTEEHVESQAARALLKCTFEEWRTLWKAAVGATLASGN